MDQSSNSKRLRVNVDDVKSNSNDSSQKKSEKSLKLNFSGYMDHIFHFLSLIDLSHCQQLNKLWQKRTKKAIQSDARTYASIRVKRKQIDIGDYPLPEVDDLILKYIKKTDDKDEMIKSIDSRIQLLEDMENKLRNLLNKNEECIGYIMDNLVYIVKQDTDPDANKLTKHKLTTSNKYDPQTFITIEYPYSITSRHTHPHTVITADQLLSLAGLTQQNETMHNYFAEFDQKKWMQGKLFEFCLDYSQRCYYEQNLEREVMKIILSNAKVLEYFDLTLNNKNLLLLDWDRTLYCFNSQRPHLIEFLKCATKYCVIFINTWSKQAWNIHELNQNEGIHISGVFNLSRKKSLFNQWIKNFHWCNIDKQYLNFLLIDDRNERCTNFLHVPKFEGDENDEVLLKLIPWLKQWHQYTSVDKQGTTNQFIKSNPISF